MTLLDISDLRVTFPGASGPVQAVRGVRLSLAPGESLGVVGESGSGKSVSCMAALRLLPATAKVEGRLSLCGIDMARASKSDLAQIRGRAAAMIFQDPMSAFDPVFPIGAQIVETIRAHRPGAPARAEARALLARVEIRDPDAAMQAYPHQLSGGMLQRAMIAMALSCQPRLLIADEPTTALDVTVQAQILQLIKDMQAEAGMGLVMITHDLGVIAETVDRVTVLYGGHVMEEAPTADLFDHPAHPYTRALLDSIPGQSPGRQRLSEIPGSSPDPAKLPQGCPFHPRCARAHDRCRAEAPPLTALSPTRATACWSPL
ncbi:ABC transporter ATP-binding protein [Stagnihabitans tardus]|uniref:ATP-binding cassette domain-containing protein n=1 Tax=Stagnihabitans tardus TaxID=2699202 RepID=A0AAE5BWU2_9RHOB|nr:oligopeptide/dipeptide ABC transporter ATP-binding protein [Stagnihabitans tardus]NBZ89149.1 ATP-binding cassette domain-containing protein [Stagnihabitans tardus]